METLQSRVSTLVFVDAHLPDDGESGAQTSNDREEILAAQLRGDPARRPRSAADFGVNDRDRAWVDSLLTPQPLGTSLQPIRLTGARDRVRRKAYVRATGWPSDPFEIAFAKAKARGWIPFEAPCGHDVMIDAPELLAQIFVAVATGKV